MLYVIHVYDTYEEINCTYTQEFATTSSVLTSGRSLPTYMSTLIVALSPKILRTEHAYYRSYISFAAQVISIQEKFKVQYPWVYWLHTCPQRTNAALTRARNAIFSLS